MNIEHREQIWLYLMTQWRKYAYSCIRTSNSELHATLRSVVFL